MANKLTTGSSNMRLWKEHWQQGIAAIKVNSDMQFAELWRMDTPSVATLNAGEKNTLQGEAVFGALINALVKFFGAIWSPMQIAECARVCFDEWYYLSFAELAHFAQRAKAGYFKEPGKQLFYGAFSPAHVIEWMCTYTAQNLEEREAYFGNPHNNNSWEPPPELVSEERVQELLAVIAEIEHQVTAEKEAEEAARAQRRAVELEKFRAYLERCYKARGENTASAPQQ